MNVSEWYRLNKPNLDAFDLKLMMQYWVSGIKKSLIKNIDKDDYLNDQSIMRDKIIALQINMADKLEPKWYRSKKDRSLKKPKWLFQTNIY